MADFFTGTGWSFGFEISGMMFKEITKVEGIKLEMDVIELKTQSLTGTYTRKKLPGRMKSGTLTMTRALPMVGTSHEFIDWIQHAFVADMTSARKMAHLYVYPVAALSPWTPTPLLTFTAYNCWPTSIEYGTFEAGNTGNLTEKVSIHHEGLYAEVGAASGTQPQY